MGSCRHMADLAKVIHKVCDRARYLLGLWLNISEHWAVLSLCHPSLPKSKRDHFKSDLSELYVFPQPKCYREAVGFPKGSSFLFFSIYEVIKQLSGLLIPQYLKSMRLLLPANSDCYLKRITH